MRFGSLFSGVGGMDLGLEQAGMECAWQVEIDEFCRKVLTKHWPNVPKFTDIKTVNVDTSANIIYDERHGWTKEELSRCGKSLRAGDVDSGSGSILWNQSSGNVGLVETSGGKVPIQSALWDKQSLSSRNKSERLRSERPGEGDTERDRDPQDSLRSMRGCASIQERANGDSGPSLRLQQAIEGDVAMSTLPPSVAQRTQSYSKEINGKPFADSRIDLLCGGFP